MFEDINKSRIHNFKQLLYATSFIITAWQIELFIIEIKFSFSILQLKVNRA